MVWVHSLMLVFTLAAAVCDIARQKIYNVLVYPGILVGIAANALIPGGCGLQDSLLGFLVCGGVMVVATVFFDVGGGDVKLVAMMGAFLGLYGQGNGGSVEAMLWTFVIGAVMGIAALIWRVGIAELIRRIVTHLRVMLKYRQPVPLSETERTHLKAPLMLAPAALLAELIVVFHLVDKLL